MEERMMVWRGHRQLNWRSAALLMLAVLILIHSARASTAPKSQARGILVVGSINVDFTISVKRLPFRGETLTATAPYAEIAVGGKGANQAVAAARLSQGTGRPIRFICRFGNDSLAETLQSSLTEDGVDISGCSRAAAMPSGQGIVMLETDGTASSIVLGGSNIAWPDRFSGHHLLDGIGLVLLQREIPDAVNLAVAQAARKAGLAVILDIGGEDRPITDGMLRLIDYVAPNESELQRLTGAEISTKENVIAAANGLIARGAQNVLVTLSERGALFIRKNGSVLHQEAIPVPGGVVVDGTAAGDAFRAGFAVALLEGWSVQECLKFAAAAGSYAVSRMGAFPSLPTREQALELMPPLRADGSSPRGPTPNQQDSCSADEKCSMDRGSQTCNNTTVSDTSSRGHTLHPDASSSAFPYKFASRLNSMQARPDLDLTAQAQSHGVLGWIHRQGNIKGLDLVDLNYPQHFEGVPLKKIKSALASAGLAPGALCIRFPSTFRLGAFTNPNATLRQSAVSLAIEGCKIAADLGARDLIVWSPFDGYDYYLQMDYQVAWKHTVASFQTLSDACPPGLRVSLEFKPTDESSRLSIVPSTGAALLLEQAVGRPNFGLTLDVGHLLMAGENPAQSVAMVGLAGKLFGMQLNDAHVKLGAEDGLAFGAVNSLMALELVTWLRKIRYDGHLYYDTFPRNEDPVKEAEYNIRRFKVRAILCWGVQFRIHCIFPQPQ